MGISNAVVPLGGSLTVPQWVKHRVTVWSNNSTARYIPKINKNIHPHTKKFRAALLVIAEKWKQSKCPSTDKKITKTWYIHTMKHYSVKNVAKYYSAIKRNDTSYNMDEPWKHTSWKKQGTKGHILYDSIHMKCPK